MSLVKRKDLVMTKSAAACAALTIGFTLCVAPAFAQITAGTYHTTALTTGGVVWAWGYNGYGQVGDNTNTSRLVPTQVLQAAASPAPHPPLFSVCAIAAGELHSLAATCESGIVWAWGNNDYGQIGDGTNSWRNTAVQLTLSGVVAIAAGSYHSVALKSDGTVWTWGLNASGQLGDGTTTERTLPVQVTGVSGIVAIAAGHYHTLAVKNDGTVWAWGRNSSNELGDGSAVQRNSPVQLPSLTGVIAVAGGTMHSLALKADGTVMGWGSNSYGQLGDATLTSKSTPQPVARFLPFVTAIAAGEAHSLFVGLDGYVRASGQNTVGQLGDGTTTNRQSPVQVLNLSGISRVSAGYLHSVALARDGTVWTWGQNSDGESGDGTRTNPRTSPELIIQGNNAVASTNTTRPPAARYGIVTDGLPGNNVVDPTGTIYTNAIGGLGVGLIRQTCNWETLEPQRNSFPDWSCVDNVKDGHHRVLITVNCTPTWARSGGECHTMPTNMVDWTDFVQSFITKYGGQDVILGIYNEPNLGDEQGRVISTTDYCTLFSSAATVRNTSAYPDFALAGPETSIHARHDGYLDPVLGCLHSTGALAAQDIVTVHYYDGYEYEPGMPEYLDDVRVSSGAHNDVWISEIGYKYTNDRQQASFYIGKLYGFETMALTRPWLNGIIFYRLWASRDDLDAPYGILDPDDFSHRDTYAAYNAVLAEVTGAGAGTLGPDQILAPDTPMYSASGTFKLQYQSDGNLVEYVNDDGTWDQVWASNTSPTSAGHAIVQQSDGNFVVYDASGKWWFTAAITGYPNAYLVLEDDGAIYLYSQNGSPLWAVNDPYRGAGS
jgi:alpha-tubulin suppressor-like RCC1 family protein